MQRRTIDPKDVPQMFRDGTLWFGIELEFDETSGEMYNTWKPRKLFGFNPKKGRYLTDWGIRQKARFPLPDLRDGDPVVVYDLDMPPKEHKRIFAGFEDDGSILVYDSGTTKWTNDKRTLSTWGDDWRIPTPDELEDAGLDRDWFKGRRGINQKEEK